MTVSSPGLRIRGSSGPAIRLGRIVGRLLPALAITLGALLGLGGLLVAPAVLGSIADALPIDVLDPTSPAVVIPTAVALLALAIGLARGKRLSWLVAITVLGAACVEQIVENGHPVAAAAGGLCLVVLVADRRRYQIQTDIAWRRRIALLVVLALAALGAAAAVTAINVGATGGRTLGLDSAFGVLIDGLSLSDTAATTTLAGWGGVVALLLLLMRLPIALSAIGILQPVAEPAPDPSVRERMRAILATYGSGALLPFQAEPTMRGFEAGDRRGLVVYGRAGRTAVVLGDPIGEPERAWAAFRSFIAACRVRDHEPAVYQAGTGAAARLRRLGFRTFEVGREAILDLDGFTLAGSRRANLRHTVTRFRRDGGVARWYPNGLSPATPARPADHSVCVRELAEIDTDWRRRPGPSLRFTIHGFEPADLSRVGVAVALEPDGRPSAFATFRPTGTDGGWVLDLVRRRMTATPGAIEACVVAAAEALRDAGAPTLSLGLAPLAGLSRGAGPAEERWLARTVDVVRRWYDVRGLVFFKAKFDPRWVPRYGASRGRTGSIGLALGLLRLHLAGDGGSWRQVVRALLPRRS